MGPQDRAALGLLSGYNKGLTCLLCAQCVSICPEHIGIADIFRYERYARDYHDLDRAHSEYAALTRNGTSCVGCGDCLRTCSQEIDIAAKLKGCAPSDLAMNDRSVSPASNPHPPLFENSIGPAQ